MYERIIFTSFIFAYTLIIKLKKSKSLTKSSILKVLTKEQMEFFYKYGYIVIPNVLTKEEIEEAKNGMHETLLKYDVVIFNFFKIIFYYCWKKRIQMI